MKTIISLTLNGDDFEVMVSAADFLVDLIRDTVGLTGTKRAAESATAGCRS